MLILDTTTDLSQLGSLAQEIARHLNQTDPFCLWLEGSIGAGKTTPAGEILYALGLDRREPVISPTFTYMNEYKIQEGWYAHLDFYRVEGPQHIEDFGLLDTRQFRGVFIEWPLALAQESSFAFTHKLQISVVEKGLKRRYQLSTL